MIKKIFQLLGLIPSDNEAKIMNAVAAKQRRLKKYNGKLVIGNGFMVSESFDRKKDKIDYEKRARKRYFEK